MLLLGSHVSVSGGVFTAYERAARIGCTSMQIFVKNANQWAAKPLSDDDIRAFRDAAAQSTVSPVVAHAAYLINLCAGNPDILKKSRAAYEDELRRCEALGIHALVFHPGSHGGTGEEGGIRSIAESLNGIHDRTKGFRVLTTLETTAGQGYAVGYRFEHLRSIIDLVKDQDRMAVCIDTCHLFAAGYPVQTPEGWETTMSEFESVIGLRRLAVIHVNDSKKPFGSRLDRHEHIGKGLIGNEGFRSLMNDSRLERVPKILETEKSEDMHEDVENMETLKKLIRKGSSRKR